MPLASPSRRSLPSLQGDAEGVESDQRMATPVVGGPSHLTASHCPSPWGYHGISSSLLMMDTVRGGVEGEEGLDASRIWGTLPPRSG